MILPIRDFVKSKVLVNQINGKLSPSILEKEPGLAGGPTVTLIKPAMRGWRALTDAGRRAGHIFKAAGPADSYRIYEIQERIFLDRYQTTPIPTRDRKFWRGRWWYLKAGKAPAAVPGESNHGWASAIDTGTEQDHDPGTESITSDPEALQWLLDNAHFYGFSWELQSEKWHIRWYVGDAIPPAVLAYEEAAGKFLHTSELTEEVNMKTLEPVNNPARNQICIRVPDKPIVVTFGVNDWGYEGATPESGAAIRLVWRLNGQWVPPFENKDEWGFVFVGGADGLLLTVPAEVRQIVATHSLRETLPNVAKLPVDVCVYT